MSTLDMCTFYVAGHFNHRPKCSTWRIGTVDGKNAEFPSSERIIQLFEEHLPGIGALVVAWRYSESNCIGVEIPQGTTPKRRQPFLDALTKETQFS